MFPERSASRPDEAEHLMALSERRLFRTGYGADRVTAHRFWVTPYNGRDSPLKTERSQVAKAGRPGTKKPGIPMIEGSRQTA